MTGLGPAALQVVLAVGLLSAFAFGTFAVALLRERGRRSQLSRRARRIARERLPNAGAQQRLPWGLSLAARMDAEGPGGAARAGAVARAMGSRLERLVEKGGVGGEVSASGLGRASVRLGVLGCVAGAAVGAALSFELAMLLGAAGAVAGAGRCARELKNLREQRNRHLARELPEMLEVVALGLRSGLTFDRALDLYARHFDTSLARDCERAASLWSAGLASREEALSRMARGYDSPQLERTARTMARCLRLGTPLAPALEEAAAEARAAHKAQLQERVAKAPVKMMVPTAALMLPAMLLLVMGPVLLQLMEG